MGSADSAKATDMGSRLRRKHPSYWTNILGGTVSSIPATLFSFQEPAGFCHSSPPCSHELTETVHLHVRWADGTLTWQKNSNIHYWNWAVFEAWGI